MVGGQQDERVVAQTALVEQVEEGAQSSVGVPQGRVGDGGPGAAGVVRRPRRNMMKPNLKPSTAAVLCRGVLAVLAGTVVMTAFQKLVEMPITQRQDSYDPANVAQNLLPVQPTIPTARRRLNLTTHYALGGMWGAAYGIAAVNGLRGQKAVNTVSAVVYTGDVLLNTALGLYQPSRWTAKDWTIDIVDKYVQAQATGAVFDRALDPARLS